MYKLQRAVLRTVFCRSERLRHHLCICRASSEVSSEGTVTPLIYAVLFPRSVYVSCQFERIQEIQRTACEVPCQW